MARYSRMRRHTTAGTGGWEYRRLMSLVLLSMVLYALYQYAREPSTWRWIERESEARASRLEASAKPVAKVPAWKETLGNGPPQSAPDELDGFKHQLQAVSDLAPLVPAEMPAYWRLMRWALAEPMADLERRALPSVIFTQLYEDPNRYRGKLIRLRLHIRRILDYEAPENSAGIKRVYELWAWTDDSRSYPYVVVVPEVPPWFKLGDELREEAVFVGYFLKTMSYMAFNKKRAAPLLVGRLRPLSGTSSSSPRRIAAGGPGEWIWGSGLVVVVGVVLWFCRPVRRAQPSLVLSAPAGPDVDFGEWMSAAAGPTEIPPSVPPAVEPAPSMPATGIAESPPETPGPQPSAEDPPPASG